jgi:hypothetical protein
MLCTTVTYACSDYTGKHLSSNNTFSWQPKHIYDFSHETCKTFLQHNAYTIIRIIKRIEKSEET